MDPITDPRAIKFCNEEVRTQADRIAQLYYRSKETLQLWETQEIAAIIPAPDGTPGSVVAIVDGSPADARPPLNNAKVTGFMSALVGIVAKGEEVDPVTGIRLIDLITSIAVNIRE